jgi:hypothetical protein
MLHMLVLFHGRLRTCTSDEMSCMFLHVRLCIRILFRRILNHAPRGESCAGQKRYFCFSLFIYVRV